MRNSLLRAAFGLMCAGVAFWTGPAFAGAYRLIALDPPGAARSHLPYALSNSGLVGGTNFSPSGNITAFVAGRSGYAEIAPPPGFDRATVRGINANGVAVGEFLKTEYALDDMQTVTLDSLGFVARRGEVKTFRYPTATTMTSAYGINDRGQIVGVYGSGGYHGFLWDNGTFTTIDAPNATYSTSVTGINNLGVMVGTYVGNAGLLGFVADAGVFVDLDVPGADYTVPVSINDAGQIVGNYYIAGNQFSFLYEDGVFAPLSVAATGSTVVNAIDNNGDIAGAHFLNGRYRAFVAIPVAEAALAAAVPEPASLAMLAFGVLATGVSARRSRGRAAHPVR